MKTLHEKAAKVGLVISTWSPGDGATRYCFHDLSTTPVAQCDYHASDGIFTALGRKEAQTFLRGFAEGIFASWHRRNEGKEGGTGRPSWCNRKAWGSGNHLVDPLSSGDPERDAALDEERRNG